METLKDILWTVLSTVLIVGGLGAFIDFLIGNAGQAKAKDFLLKWWVRFDDVRWRNFGREEGLFAGRLIEKWFGRRMCSLRRVISTLIIFIVCFVILNLEYKILTTNPLYFYTKTNLFGNVWAFFIAFVGFSVGITFTKFITFRMAYACGIGEMRNSIIFLMMLFINYVVFVTWLPITIAMKNNLTTVIVLLSSDFSASQLIENSVQILLLIGYIIRDAFIQILTGPLVNILTFSHEISFVLLHPVEPIVPHALLTMSTVPSLFRFSLSIVFLGSFLLRPLVMRPISLVWARVVESEKPVFTLIFGFAGALAKLISEAAKRL
jgi:hypothetical protein